MMLLLWITSLVVETGESSRQGMDSEEDACSYRKLLLQSVGYCWIETMEVPAFYTAAHGSLGFFASLLQVVQTPWTQL